MRRLQMSLLAAVLVAAAVSLVPDAGRSGSQTARACAWRTFSFKSGDGLSSNDLSDIEALSASDVWVVGTDETFSISKRPVWQPLILHWDGVRWKRVGARADEVGLWAISSTSPSDMWAVGTDAEGGHYRPAALHWNGSQWRRVPTPSDPRAPRNNDFEDVVAISATEAWAVGQAGGGTWPLLERWNGRAWTRVSTPFTGHGELAAVDGSSPTNVWMVGYTEPEPGFAQAIALRWNGRSWAVTRLPEPLYSESVLHDVSVVSDKAAWAVGHSNTTADRPEDAKIRGYAIRWAGDMWRDSGTADSLKPIPGGGDCFNGVHAESPTRAWVWRYHAALGEWDGRRWRPGPRVPFANKQDAVIAALDTARDGTLWLTGSYWSGTHTTNVIARYACDG